MYKTPLFRKKYDNTKMGICSSCESTDLATAKLVLQDGSLQEFTYPIKVSYLLQKYPTCFICNSDEMDFDDAVSAVHGDEVLQPGQLYFALPLTWLRHPLQAEEMAALAVKASAALMKSSDGDKCGCGGKTVVSAAVYGEKEGRVCGGKVAERGGAGRRRGKGRTKRFEAMLSAIPE